MEIVRFVLFFGLLGYVLGAKLPRNRTHNRSQGRSGVVWGWSGAAWRGLGRRGRVLGSSWLDFERISIPFWYHFGLSFRVFLTAKKEKKLQIIIFCKNVLGRFKQIAGDDERSHIYVRHHYERIAPGSFYFSQNKSNLFCNICFSFVKKNKIQNWFFCFVFQNLFC